MTNQETDTGINAVLGAMQDPKQVAEVRAKLHSMMPALEKLEGMVRSGDPVVNNAANEICCFVCDVIKRLGAEFDPHLAHMVVSVLTRGVAVYPDTWRKYTEERAEEHNEAVVRTDELVKSRGETPPD